MKITALLLASGMLLAAAPASAQAPCAVGTKADATAKAAASLLCLRPPEPGGVTDPVAWVRGAYSTSGGAEGQLSGGTYSSEPVFSPRLRALFRDDERYADGQVGRLGFNPFTGAQDDDIKQAAVVEHAVDGAADRKVVVARFQNMDASQVITYFFQRIAGRWYIDDIAGRQVGKDEPSWALSLILKYGSHGE